MEGIMTAPAFTREELQAMHRWCLKYRDLVRSGGTPTAKQDDQFLVFSRVCYAEGIARGR
jgi:hypothetical protein